MLPSPLAFARITRARYLNDITMINDHVIRDSTPDVLRRRDHVRSGLQGLPEGIERTGADIAVHDPEGAQSQRGLGRRTATGCHGREAYLAGSVGRGRIGGGCLTEKPVDRVWIAWPCLEDGVPWDLFGGVAKRKRNYHDVIQRSDDRQELGDQVDGGDHPEAGKCERNLGTARHERILPKAPNRGHTVGQKSCQLPQGTLGEAGSKHHQRHPRHHDDESTDHNHRCGRRQVGSKIG